MAEISFFENSLYKEDLAYIASLDLPWNKLRDSSMLISGGTGLLGSFIVDAIMNLNEIRHLNCHIYAIGRNKERAQARFPYLQDSDLFTFVAADINKSLPNNICEKIDYVVHLASNTHPVDYATKPIETILTNIIGTMNMLNFAVSHNAKRFAFASSNEIYGENRGDKEFFDESYCGYIDCNTMRAGYPESKRCGEALCQAYIAQHKLDVVIPRFTRSYGSTLLQSDTKALSQFVRKALAGEDIVLKSKGTQFYSYTYVADAVAGFFTVLLNGKCGEAYNIADEASDITLRDLASIIAESVGKKVVFEIPDSVESAGYSKATKARLDAAKLKSMGWTANYNMKSGLKRTIEMLKE